MTGVQTCALPISGSLAFWARLYKLRMHATAQEECKPIVSEIGKHMKELFPVSWDALTNTKTATQKEEVYYGA